MTPKRLSKKSPLAEKWVVNASPVIALARIGQVELLTQLPARAVTPRAVADELLQAPEGDPARRAVESSLFRIVKTPTPPPELLAWDLGKGETSVLTYALANAEWVVVLDDAAALLQACRPTAGRAPLPKIWPKRPSNAVKSHQSETRC
jgi:predicted nucleic acid-binding protein